MTGPTGATTGPTPAPTPSATTDRASGAVSGQTAGTTTSATGPASGATRSSNTVLDRVLGPNPPPFALLYRREADDERVDVLVGDVEVVGTLAELPVPTTPDPGAGHDLVVLVPYRQVAERGFAHHDDGRPLVALRVREQDSIGVEELLERLPNQPIALRNRRFEPDDEVYARQVADVVEHEIGRGEGANFVIRRSFAADLDDATPAAALAFYRRLLAGEEGTYWTFIVHTGTSTLVGASPERHVSLHDGVASMSPISGTYRYPPTGPDLSGLMGFLADEKETDELYMVVDEELKMMCRVCDGECRVDGPRLREMARLAHTEYLITGRCTRDVREVLRETMFAPTVTGSPIENACRVIARHESGGRGYYSGVVALIGRDGAGQRELDSAIVIRTAEITRGELRIGVGATLVRDSDPRSEVAETAAKASALLSAIGADGRLGAHPEVVDALERRNTPLAGFWLDAARDVGTPVEELVGRRVLLVDAEDTFTAMLDSQLRSLGLRVRLVRYDEPVRPDDHDLVVLGPGPGDPRADHDPRVAALRRLVRGLLDGGRPLLAVCLSHQVLARELGLVVRRRPTPNQGVRRTIDLFGRVVDVGFYNSFAAYSPHDVHEGGGVRVEVCRDVTGEVHALRGPGFRSVQFHAESVISRDGLDVLRGLVLDLLARDSVVVR
ncbi:chorismate-binding protein [Saccharothrix sp. S26]|uniref:anthranilate synthase family protein n=1 Tax=Saccharothrix sp. S26 TaxID=2907215 RepID=UPI001F166E2F|nr:chorismate-binding protein [Saccharothrix sp. S26]MCE7000785.1 chorismate-binding protein [Saccharothrix sp. S26]